MGLFREQIHLPKSKYSFVGLGNKAFQGGNPAQIQIFMCEMGRRGPFREQILPKSKYPFVGWVTPLSRSADEIPTDIKTDTEPAQKKLGLVR